MWNLIWWFDDLNTNCQINIRQNEFSSYYKLLVLYHFIKLKFIKCYFEVNSSNLFPVNISSYTVSSQCFSVFWIKGLCSNIIMCIPFTSCIPLFRDTLDLYSCFSLWSTHTKWYIYVIMWSDLQKQSLWAHNLLTTNLDFKSWNSHKIPHLKN